MFYTFVELTGSNISLPFCLLRGKKVSGGKMQGRGLIVVAYVVFPRKSLCCALFLDKKDYSCGKKDAILSAATYGFHIYPYPFKS